MIDRSELMEAALESFPEGLALLSREGEVDFWNRAAENITGFPSMEMRHAHGPLGSWSPSCIERPPEEAEGTARTPKPERGALIHAQHRFGQELPLMRRTVILRDTLGGRIGSAVIFHLAESLDTLPHGESCEESNLEAAQEEIEEQATIGIRGIH